MKITKRQLRSIIKEEKQKLLKEYESGAARADREFADVRSGKRQPLPSKQEAMEVLNAILSDIRQNASSNSDAKKAAAAEVLLTVIMDGYDPEGAFGDMFPNGLKAFREEYGIY
tara:strand:+ start:710 stop:1051 length:342 start_codon:yes stop_codon:yes gene_type:complete